MNNDNNKIGIILLVIVFILFLIVLFIQIMERHKMNLPTSISDIHGGDHFIIELDEQSFDIIVKEININEVHYSHYNPNENGNEIGVLSHDEFLSSIIKRK